MARSNATFSLTMDAINNLAAMCEYDSKSAMIESLIHAAHAKWLEIQIKRDNGDAI